MKISDGIREVEKSAQPIVSTLLTFGVGLLVIGVVSGIAIGFDNMPAAFVDFFNGTWITNIISVFTSSTGALVTVISLLVVAVLIALFGMKRSGKAGRSM